MSDPVAEAKALLWDLDYIVLKSADWRAAKERAAIKRLTAPQLLLDKPK